MTIKFLPESRTENIVVQSLNKETLIYDLVSHQAYSLNETATIVFNACSEKILFAELKDKYNFTDDFIYLCLDELSNESLLKEKYYSPLKRMNRREAVKLVGLATSATLPLIVSIIAPAAVQATSTAQGFNNNEACTILAPFQSSECLSGHCIDPSVGVGGYTGGGLTCCVTATSLGYPKDYNFGCTSNTGNICIRNGPLLCCSGSARLEPRNTLGCTGITQACLCN